MKKQARETATAYYDPLTGLPNKDFFFISLTQAITLAARNKKVAAVLFICVDRLKLINDTLGETYGNKLLKEPVAQIR